MVVAQPTVAEATRDRAPPIRVTMGEVPRNPLLVKSKEYQVSGPIPVSESGTHSRVYTCDEHQFSEKDLPILPGSDTAILNEKEQKEALDVIASVNEPVAITSGDEDLNQVADPETIGRENKEKSRKVEEKCLENIRKDLKDQKVLDVLCRLINLPNREMFRIDPRVLDTPTQCGKQCPGGGNGGSNNKGSQTESSSSQSGQGRSSLVVGVGGGGFGGLGGAGGGDDEDPNNFRPFNLPPSHYTDFMGYEEQPQMGDDAQRNAAMAAVLTQGMVCNPMLSQFNCTQEEPISTSLDEMRQPDFDFDGMDLGDFSNDDFIKDAAQYLSPSDPMFPVTCAEESVVGVTGVVQMAQASSDAFPMAEESSEIKDSIDMIHMMVPTQRPQANSIPHSQIPGLNPVSSYAAPLPSPAPSTASSYLAPTPSPLPPRTPMTPMTPAPMTPSTPQPRGVFLPKSFIEGDKRVFDLSIAPDIPNEKRNTAFRAVFYLCQFYQEVVRCSQSDMDLKVANDVRANMCPMDYSVESHSLKLSLNMPKDCKPLSQWLQSNKDLKDRLLILQQILNTLAIIHTVGYENDLTLWGSFMVWVASDLRVYLLVDFPMLLQRQQQQEMSECYGSPRMLDVMKVKEIYSKLIVPCIGRDGYWASPGLRSALQAFEYFLHDTRSSCRMAEAARMLGEKRVCKVDVDVCISVVFYCLEREELQTALRELSRIAPSRISTVWTVQSVISGGYMQIGDIATADRPMHLSLAPCMYPSDGRLLYITCEDSG